MMSGGKTMEKDPYVIDDITKEEERDIYRKAADAIYEIFGRERFLQFFALHDSDPHQEFSFIVAEKASEIDPDAFVPSPDFDMPDKDLISDSE